MNYNLKDYSPDPTGNELCTTAFQSAIDACHAAGGGVVFCGPGEYKCASIELKSNVELHLSPGCRIVASTCPDDFQDLISKGFNHEISWEKSARFLIGARHAKNIAITGSGIIDGSGPSFYDHTVLRPNGQFGIRHPNRIRLVMFHKCEDVRLEGTTYQNGPCWAIWLMVCQRVQVRGIKIFSDWRVINGDGIDIDGCRDVTVSDCIMDTEDDCIALYATTHQFTEPVICENIVVTNCTLTSKRHGVRVSFPRNHIVRDCLFSNLNIKGASGIFMHFRPRFSDEDGTGYSHVENLSFSNILIEGRSYSIRIEVEDGVRLTKLSGISFSDIRSKSKGPLVIMGSPQTTIEDIHFRNARFVSSAEQAVTLAHAKGITFDQVTFEQIPAETE